MSFSVINFFHLNWRQCYILGNLCFCDVQSSWCLGNGIVCCYIFGSYSESSTFCLDLKFFSKCSCVGSHLCSLDLIACVYFLSCYKATCIFRICFFYCITCLLILVSCIRLITCPSVSCDGDRSCRDRQLFFSCNISIIVSFTGYSYVYSYVTYICCCDL